MNLKRSEWVNEWVGEWVVGEWVVGEWVRECASKKIFCLK